MGNLIEVATWSAGIPYFEADAILTGGPDCPDNIPIQALANRTAFLKKQIDDAVSGALTVMYANRLKTARTISMSGDGTWSVSFDGNGNVTSAMTLANTTVVAGTYPVVTVDTKGRATAGRALQSADLPASPALTGTPTAPTAAAGTNTTQIASTAFVQAAVAALIASSPAALDTLNELATALGNDPNFATTMTNALAAKAPLASPALTGNPTAPTAVAGANTTQLATTAFVQQEIAGDLATATPLMAGAGAVGTATKLAREDHRHPTDSTRAPLASPVFTGTPAAPTAVAGTNTTQLATTAFVQAAVAALIASSPAALDTLNELATALGDDPNFAATITNALAGKAALAGSAAQTFSVAAGTQASHAPNLGQFLATMTGNDYLKIPVMVGGVLRTLIVQWCTSGSVVAGGSGTVTLPLAFPNVVLFAIAAPLGGSQNNSAGNVVAGTPSLGSVPLYNWGVISAPAKVLAIGW